MLKIRKILYLLISSIVFSLYSCFAHHHKLSFDVNTQILSSCDSGVIKKLCIDNDSIQPNGFLYEGGVILIWNGELEKTPNEINITNISNDYIFSKAGKKIKEYKLLPNSRYTIEKWGGHNGIGFTIKVWTDNKGRVYKTTNPECGMEGIR